MSSVALSSAEQDKIVNFLDHPNVSFTDLSKQLGLSPSKDFRYVDLRKIDFSNSDLRGFDFSGSDLTQSYGRNVKFDETTNLSSAKTSGSLFSFRQGMQERHNHEDWENLVLRKAGRDDFSKIDFLTNRARNVDEKHEDKKLAQWILHESNSSFLVGSALFSIEDYFSKPQELIDFFNSVYACKHENTNLLFNLSRVMGQINRRSKAAFELLYSMLLDPRPKLALSAFNSLSKSIFFRDNINEIKDVVLGNDWENVRLTSFRSAYLDTWDLSDHPQTSRLEKIFAFDPANTITSKFIKNEILPKITKEKSNDLKYTKTERIRTERWNIINYFEQINKATNIQFKFSVEATSYWQLNSKKIFLKNRAKTNPLRMPQAFNMVLLNEIK